jgi:hypothetical protein
MFGGNPKAAGVKDLLRLAPICYVTPQTAEWRHTLQDEFGTRIATLPFAEFSSVALDPAHLAKLIQAVAPGFELKRVDKALAAQLPSDTGNE